MPYGRPFQNSSTIGDIVAGGVAGSVLFVGAGLALAQDNANFFWDDTNDQLQLNAVGAGAGILIGGDTQWYRSAANVLRTPDAVQMDSTLAVASFATVGDDAKGALQVTPARDLAGSISGLTYSNNAGDATNDLDIATGVAIDSTAAYFLRLATAITKQSDVAWAVGTNAGGLDTGVVGNSDYYIHLIARSDTGVVDVLFSLSSTAPNMPANYNFRRMIGWFKRVGGTIVAFTTYESEGGGLEFSWNVPTLDIDLASTLTTSRRTDAVKVPLNFAVIAHLNVVLTDAGSDQASWICCPDQTDAAPSDTNAPLGNARSSTTASFFGGMRIQTSSAGLIAARSSVATVDIYRVSTLGFTWDRRD